MSGPSGWRTVLCMILASLIGALICKFGFEAHAAPMAVLGTVAVVIAGGGTLIGCAWDRAVYEKGLLSKMRRVK